MIEEQYPFLQCSIQNKVLVCTGWLQPDNCRDKYKVKVEYVAGHEPKSTVLWPKIEPSRDIHMYKDHSLCLHYPKDMPWNEKIKIYQYTIPWISEWIVFYEIYLINGNIWEGRQSPTHFTETDQNLNKNTD
ncbi:MAG: hypothetical protein HYZ15_04025 [Sphingobacteriales bacterium]|nr:hypothetical protein [Sphingobacteriales bacterium]